MFFIVPESAQKVKRQIVSKRLIYKHKNKNFPACGKTRAKVADRAINRLTALGTLSEKEEHGKPDCGL